jgi:hypothetical protein
VLIDKALTRGYVLSPLAAPHHRRDGLVFRWPSDKGTQVRPSPGGGRGNTRMTYEQIRSAGSCAPSAANRPTPRQDRDQAEILGHCPGRRWVTAFWVQAAARVRHECAEVR